MSVSRPIALAARAGSATAAAPHRPIVPRGMTRLGAEIVSPYATCLYSWTSPPRRSRRTVPIHRSAIAFAFRARASVSMTRIPGRLKIASKATAQQNRKMASSAGPQK